MLRRTGLIAAGLVMATSFALAGVGTASAALLRLKANSTWTLETKTGCLQADVFESGGAFIAYNGVGPNADRGTWSVRGKTISMIWTSGGDVGQSFTGHFVTTTTPHEYKGGEFIAGNFVQKAMLVKGLFCDNDG